MTTGTDAEWWTEYDWVDPLNIDNDFYAIRIRADQALDDDDARTLFGAIGYAFAQHFRGERLGEPQRIGPNEWAAWYDITKSRSDDWLHRLDDAVTDAKRYAVEGSPPRKTSRGGPIGSRLVEGLGRPIRFEIYFSGGPR